MSLSFNELIPNASVRVTMIGDMTYMSIRDLIMVLCQKNNNDAGETWRNIPEIKKSEVQEKVLNFKFPGRGQQTQPVITMDGALKLLMWLPGDHAKSYRIKATDIIMRYLAGDSTLIQEIQANAESQAPVNQLARATLGKHERELEALEIQERRARLKKLESDALVAQAESQRVQAEAQDKWMQLYTSLCPNKTMDERARLMFKDNVLNLSNASGGQKALENGAGSSKPITISTLAAQLGLKFTSGELQSIGVEVKKRFYEKYNEDPPRHEQLVNGAVRNVCSYTERDRDLVEGVLKGYKRT